MMEVNDFIPLEVVNPESMLAEELKVRQTSNIASPLIIT